MMLAHLQFRKKKEGERGKSTVHAKLMYRDIHRHTPAKAKLDTIETQLTFK